MHDNKKLALFGGSKTINRTFKRYNSVGSEEIEAVKQVVESGVLSKFIGAWDPDFFGGPKVKEFEQKCECYFKVKHAITVNSWTSGLIAAVGSIGIEPGDEVIVPPFTMCASATAIVHWNAIPVFADIEPETFCLDPKSVEENITPYTRAIMAVDIFGHSADIDSLMDIAQKHKLKVITDTAQAPGAIYKNRFAGTLSHVGGFSLNYHKHIHTGEGGVLVTNDDEIANRLRLIRNHAEAVVGDMGEKNLANMIGYNFRLGEIECAIGITQLEKLSRLVHRRQRIAQQLTEGLKCLKGLMTPAVKENCTHAYYVYPIVLDLEKLGISRDRLLEAFEAEGLHGMSGGYVNVHLLPMYQMKMAYGSQGFPWTSDLCRRPVSYAKGICPVAEELHENSLIVLPMCLYELFDEDVNLVIETFHKVWSNLNEL